jgi:hypothetical protein
MSVVERTELQVSIDAACLERVKRGMALLEKTHGFGWEEKIDLSALDISLGAACILGQLYGEYDDGVLALWGGEGDLRENDDLARQHGFLDDRHGYDHDPRTIIAFSDLEDAWRCELTPRVTA